MLCQVIVCSVRNTPQLAPSEGEQEFHVCGSLAVEAQFLLVMVAVAHFLILQAQAVQPVKAELFPVSKPLQVCIRLTEKFQLHLLKFTGTEGKVSRCDLVTEGFSHLTDTKRQFLSGGSLYILKVYENTLCSLRS